MVRALVVLSAMVTAVAAATAPKKTGGMLLWPPALMANASASMGRVRWLEPAHDGCGFTATEASTGLVYTHSRAAAAATRVGRILFAGQQMNLTYVAYSGDALGPLSVRVSREGRPEYWDAPIEMVAQMPRKAPGAATYPLGYNAVVRLPHGLRCGLAGLCLLQLRTQAGYVSCAYIRVRPMGQYSDGTWEQPPAAAEKALRSGWLVPTARPTAAINSTTTASANTTASVYVTATTNATKTATSSLATSPAATYTAVGSTTSSTRVATPTAQPTPLPGPAEVQRALAELGTHRKLEKKELRRRFLILLYILRRMGLSASVLAKDAAVFADLSYALEVL